MNKIKTFVSISIVSGLTFSSLAYSACWVTCTTGHRDCHNLNPSQCASVGRQLRDCTSQHAPGFCPSNTIQKFVASDEYINILSENEKSNVVEFHQIEQKKTRK